MIQREQSTTCLKSCKSIACDRACPKSCPQSGACEILKACFIDCVLGIVRHAGGVKFSSQVNGAAQWTGWQGAAAILSKAQVFQQHNMMASFKDLHLYASLLQLKVGPKLELYIIFSRPYCLIVSSLWYMFCIRFGKNSRHIKEEFIPKNSGYTSWCNL
jgi:hypothetical protein